MLKHKITSIIMGTLMLSGIMIGTSSINNKSVTINNTKVVNKVLLSAPSSASERAVVVNTDNSPLVLYSSADSNSNITSYISVGEMLTILSSGNDFYKVKVQETGAIGYISAHNLQIITSGVNEQYSGVNKKGYIINVSSVVNLRANATMSSNVLAKLSNNTKINVLGKQGQWCKVECNDTVGYIYQEYIGLTNKVISNSTENISNNTTNSNFPIPGTNLGIYGQVIAHTNIYSGPNSNSKPIYLNWYTKYDAYMSGVVVLAQEDNWYKVDVGTLGGVVGYVPKSDVKMINNYYKLEKNINAEGYTLPQQLNQMNSIGYIFMNTSTHKVYSLKANEKVFVISKIARYNNGQLLNNPIYLIRTSSGAIGYYSGAIKIES